ncbi:calponin homology domain-containing protein [Pavlovales sp. CCMP2436]|nr:calponin homology domain-containing protein [Pavlovales sp. CCMP2436]
MEARSVPWAAQQRAFTSWMNGRLSERGLRIDDLHRDLRDGVLLLDLLELADKTHIFVGRIRRPRHKLEEIANLNLGLDMLRERGVKLVNIGAEVAWTPRQIT